MKTFIINLGLGNSRFESISDKAERRMAVHDEVSMLAGMDDVKIQYEWSEGEYEGKTEETMVITVTANSRRKIYNFAEDLVKQFTQQCVAKYDPSDETGMLVWHPDVTDRPYRFDPSFFILPTTVRDRITSKLPKGEALALPYERLEDVFVNALEGGSNYWYYLTDEAISIIRSKVSKEEEEFITTAMLKAIMRGASVPVNSHVIRYSEDDEVFGVISMMTLKDRLQKCAEERPDLIQDVLDANDDANTADGIFQYLVLNEITFG